MGRLAYLACLALLGIALALPSPSPAHLLLWHPGSTGGGGPTPPAQAAAVGFTTLARNDDFTQAQPSNWLNCSLTTAAANWWLWYTFFGNATDSSSSGVTNNCLTQAWTFVNDPTYGTQVLDSAFLPAWAQGNPHDYTMIVTAPDRSLNNNTNQAEYPMGYFEVDQRGNYGQGDPMGWSFWSLTNDGAPQLEIDFNQIAGTNGCNAFIDWFNSPLHGTGFGAIAFCPGGVDVTQPHKYGVLWTGGNSNWHFEFFLDNADIGGTDYAPDATAVNQRNFLILWQQGTCNSAPIADATCIGTARHLYTKTVRVWSCPAWQTTHCNTQ